MLFDVFNSPAIKFSFPRNTTILGLFFHFSSCRLEKWWAPLISIFFTVCTVSPTWFDSAHFETRTIQKISRDLPQFQRDSCKLMTRIQRENVQGRSTRKTQVAAFHVFLSNVQFSLKTSIQTFLQKHKAPWRFLQQISAPRKGEKITFTIQLRTAVMKDAEKICLRKMWANTQSHDFPFEE